MKTIIDKNTGEVLYASLNEVDYFVFSLSYSIK